MPLSEHEKRLLAEIEYALSVEDPQLDLRLRAKRSPLWRRAVSGVAKLRTVMLGLMLMAVGIYDGRTAGAVVALIGYCLVVVSIAGIFAHRAARRRGES
jgi:hypothetical protein